MGIDSRVMIRMDERCLRVQSVAPRVNGRKLSLSCALAARFGNHGTASEHAYDPSVDLAT